jgi:hypothetical protein
MEATENPRSERYVNRWWLVGLIVLAALGATGYGALIPGAIVAGSLLAIVAFLVPRRPRRERRAWLVMMAIPLLLLVFVAIDGYLA